MSAVSIVVRWVARLGSLAAFLFVGAFVLGEMFGVGGQAPTLSEWIALAFFPIGVLAGMAVAWWRERLGVATTIASLAAFYARELIVRGDVPSGPWFLIVASPGVLFLLASLMEHRVRHGGD